MGLCMYVDYVYTLSCCLISVLLFCSLFHHFQSFSPSASMATWTWSTSLPLRSRQACGGSALTQTHQTQSPAGSPVHLQSRTTNQCYKKNTHTNKKKKDHFISYDWWRWSSGETVEGHSLIKTDFKTISQHTRITNPLGWQNIPHTYLRSSG